MPRAKKPATTTDKKVVAKKTVKNTSQEVDFKKLKAELKKELKKEVQKQLEEALLNIEIDAPESEVDLSSIKNEINNTLEQSIKELKNKITQPTEAKLERAELNLTGEKNFRLSSDLDGFLIEDSNKVHIAVNRSGTIGLGIRAPKAYGPGSVHIRSNYPSEAPLPSSGLHSTRGLIVEGDGDDEKSFSFRALSRQNRQGFNITGDGSLIFGDVKDKRRSKVYLNHTNADGDVLNTYVGSKHFSGNLINMQTGSAPRDNFNFFNAKVHTDKNDEKGIDVFKVDGEGTVYTETGYLSNQVGYAELFEWADLNSKNENRYGFTVSLDATGKLQIADGNDTVIGVVVKHAAVVGNAGWNAWKNKYKVGDDGNPVATKTKVVEWVDDVGILHSYYVKSLDPTFTLPENAIIYETMDDGNDIEVTPFYTQYNTEQEYTQRLKRGWTRVAMIGSVVMYKGQYVNDKWLKIADVNDELEHWILR